MLIQQRGDFLGLRCVCVALNCVVRPFCRQHCRLPSRPCVPIKSNKKVHVNVCACVRVILTDTNEMNVGNDAADKQTLHISVSVCFAHQLTTFLTLGSSPSLPTFSFLRLFYCLSLSTALTQHSAQLHQALTREPTLLHLSQSAMLQDSVKINK